ncbi:MAG: hypothetical protein LCH95_20130 [Proteobacteria bacterium]|nr:hypothetical protein [Pseudomonadota bacterium]
MVSLSQLVSSLKSELRLAMEQGKGEPMFVLSKATVKTRVQVVETEKAAGRVEFLIVKAGMGAEASNSSEHEITIELTSVGDLQLGS